MSQTATGQSGGTASDPVAPTPEPAEAQPVDPRHDPLGQDALGHPELRRLGLTRDALTADLLIGWLFAVAAGTVLATSAAPPGRVIGLLALVAGLVALALRFPRSATGDDSPEAVYRADRIGNRLGIVSGFGGLGRFGAVRMLASGVLLVLWLPRATDWLGWLPMVLAALVLTMLVAIEPFVVRLLRLPTPYAHRLPRLPQIPDRTGRAWLPPVAWLLATALIGLVAVAGLPGWIALVLAVASAIPVLALVQGTRTRRRAARQVKDGLAAAVEEYRPEFVLYTARPDDATYQLTMWLPYLTRTGRRFIIVTRDPLPAELIAGSVDLPVVTCRGVADLDTVMAPSLRAAFYVNASSGNGAMVRYHQLTHVYLGHGDSDKPPSYNPTHAMYDQIFTAGPAANRRYADHDVVIDPEKFRVVGRPQVEQVRTATAERAAERAAGSPTSILYAPTWRGHVTETALSSLDRAEEIVDALLQRGVRVIFRPHPFSYDDPEHAEIIARVQSRLAADAWERRIPHLFGPAAETDLDAFGCMNAADAMISDVSSVVSDFLFSGKPYAMVAPASVEDPAVFAEQYPVARAAYVVDHHLTDLRPVLDQLLSPATDDPRAAERTALRQDYLGDFPTDGYVDAFVAAVQDVCDHPRTSDTGVAESEDGSAAVDKDTLRRNLDALARSVVTGALAAVAVAAAVAQLPIVGVSAAVLVAVLIGWTLIKPPGPQSETPLAGPRMIISVSAGVGLVVTELVAGAPSLAAGLGSGAMLALVVAIAAERWIGAAQGFRGVEASGLPGVVSAGAGSARSRVLPATGLAIALLGWLLIFVTGAGTGLLVAVCWVFLSALQLIMVLLAVRTARRRLATELATEASLPELLAEAAPQFCVYFASGIGGRYQLGMWLPYFQRLGRPFMIITRSLPMQKEIAELVGDSDIPVIFRPTLRSLEEIVVPSLRVAFYVNNAVRNTHLIERRELTHVWLNHGDSEKPACYNPVHAIYDRIFAAGQAGIDRYARHGVRIPAEKFVLVGRPQTELIKSSREPIAEVEQPTVLYAPTWQGPYADSRVYSLPVGADLVRTLLERGVRVIFRPHPFNHRFPRSEKLVAQVAAVLAEDQQRNGTAHLWGATAEQEMTVEECFNVSDAMITDVSAVLSDYLASGKPYGVMAVGRTEEQLLEEAPAVAAGYPIAEDLSDLEPALEKLLRTDPRAPERAAMREYYLCTFDDPAAGFLSAATEEINTERRPV